MKVVLESETERIRGEVESREKKKLKVVLRVTRLRK